MKTKLPDSIKTVEDAKKFLRELHDNNEAYHCEDDACEIVNTKTNERLFTNEEGAQLNSLMGDIYNWLTKDSNFDPCGYLLFLQKKIAFENIMKVADIYTNQLLPETLGFILGIEPAWKDHSRDLKEDIYNIETIRDEVAEQEDDIHNPIDKNGEDVIEEIEVLYRSLEEADSQYFRLITIKN